MKSPSQLPAIRVVMMPRDTNPQGSIFGGVLLSLIDQAAYVEARRQAEHPYVTVAMNGVEFHKPVYVGDVLTLWAETTRIGRTSITVHVSVQTTHPGDVVMKVTEADVTLVAIDPQGRKVAVLPGS